MTRPVDRSGVDSSGGHRDRSAEETGLEISPTDGADDPPPFLGSWPRLYALVIGFLALSIVLLGWLTSSFR